MPWSHYMMIKHVAQITRGGMTSATLVHYLGINLWSYIFATQGVHFPFSNGVMCSSVLGWRLLGASSYIVCPFSEKTLDSLHIYIFKTTKLHFGCQHIRAFEIPALWWDNKSLFKLNLWNLNTLQMSHQQLHAWWQLMEIHISWY